MRDGHGTERERNESISTFLVIFINFVKFRSIFVDFHQVSFNFISPTFRWLNHVHSVIFGNFKPQCNLGLEYYTESTYKCAPSD